MGGLRAIARAQPLERFADALLEAARRRMIIAAIRHVIGKIALAGRVGLRLIVRIAVAAAIAKILHESRRRITQPQGHLERAEGLDVLARSKQGAHDGGEFFTPPSIVQTIVNVIEPDHGIVFDPACGSGGMFVQTSHFIEHEGQDTMKRVTFYGHEKNETTAKLAQINLAVHGLQGIIQAGNEAITYYKDPHDLVGKCDFVMANPPFNVDEVDADKANTDKKRLPFGLPGVNKAKRVSNANYLWLSYFYSYLNENGRTGIVMSSQASSAGRDEAVVRQKLVETGAVDVMIDVRGNFFYTRTVPCQLWFFDRAKERDVARRDHVLMLDARNIFRKVSRSVCDFSPEQQKNIAAIVWLYRGRMGGFWPSSSPISPKRCGWANRRGRNSMPMGTPSASWPICSRPSPRSNATMILWPSHGMN